MERKMPELPEVETVRRSLEPHIRGRRIIAAHTGDYRRCVATPDPDAFCSRISNNRITALGRRGKYILMHLSSGDVVTIHLRMTGELSVSPGSEPARQHLHIWLDLDDGQQIRYHDVRKFGRWALLSPEQFELFSSSLGPEPLSPEFDTQTLQTMLSSRKRTIKPLLLDQSFIVGVGNIYADEALFRAGIHPRRHSHELAPTEIDRLHAELRSVLLSALEHRGTTLRNYRDANGEPGDNLSQLQIYSLQAGDPCPRCTTPIIREVIGQRGTRYCPHCQQLHPHQPGSR
jgi:formamidopyrimidine-DNA glycosylase